MSRSAEELFHEARVLARSGQGEFLRIACGGDELLLGKVEGLLRADAEAGEFLTSKEEGGDGGTARLEGPGARVGPYTLVRVLGEGGFGTVFLAEQQKPVARAVALKVVKLGMDTRQVVARFEQEREALALMDHPNIARVLDAGATETGRPFFVMELVQGVPIIEYADENRLSIEDRLAMFEQVCHAVQHAHTKGVIHRDLKPSNILAFTLDGKPQTKVIDFGIAKATAGSGGERFTEQRQLIGTPEYMSPEQAAGSVDIDTRADVYSLGVLLYELLTGTTPFTGKELRRAAYAEVQRIIREVEPPKPSTRLSGGDDVLARLAARRRIEPKRLGVMVRGELDWIVMKAIEKDRQRRYEGASGLAADVRRYLGGEAITAAPPSGGYRAKKFMLRHRGWIAGAVAVTGALLVGLAGTSLAAAWAMRERMEARDSEAVARDQLARSQRLLSYAASPIVAAKDPAMLHSDWRAVIERVQAEASEDDVGRVRMEGLYAVWLTNAGMMAEEGVELGGVYERATRILGRDDMVRLMVVNAEIARRIGEPAALPDLYAELVGCMEGVFGADSQATLEIRLERACVLARCGWNAEATVALRDYLDRREDGERGPTPTSVVRAKAAVVAFTTPPTFIPDDVMGRLLRSCYRELRPADGVGDDEFVGVGRTYGRWLWDRRSFAEAEPVYAVLLESLRKRPVQDPTAILAVLQKLGGCILRNGRAAEAEPLLREGLTRTVQYNGEGHYYSQASRGWLGECLVAMNKYEEAEPLLLAAYEGANGSGAEADERRLACERLADLYEAMKRPEEAEKWKERVRDGG